MEYGIEDFLSCDDTYKLFAALLQSMHLAMLEEISSSRLTNMYNHLVFSSIADILINPRHILM